MNPIYLRSIEEPQDVQAMTAPTPLGKKDPTPPNANIGHEPSLQFSRATWWDCLLNAYTPPPSTASYATTARHDAASEISRDVFLFFKAAPLWLSFLNVPLFFDVFYHPELRAAVQPALVLSILAYSKFLQSHSDPTWGYDPEERQKAWRQSVALRDIAQASFEASYNAGWVDLPLAQAAWLKSISLEPCNAEPEQILSMYETSSHRHCTLYRMQSSIHCLDAVIHTLGLTSIDATDPRVATYIADTVPSVERSLLNSRKDQTHQLRYSGIGTELVTPSPGLFDKSLVAPIRLTKYDAAVMRTPFNNWRNPIDPVVGQEPEPSARCRCRDFSLASTPEVLRSTPSWTFLPRWAPNASLAEIRREEARRLVWSTIIMLGCDAFARQAAGIPQLDLHISRPENASAEVLTNWALWGRTMLLWFACVRHSSRGRLDLPLPGFSNSLYSTDDEQVKGLGTDFSMGIWMETVAIEEKSGCRSQEVFERPSRCHGRK
ncbi:hypothetical protein FRB96_007345 [Tulasnella sp. 330]|nr:hypothetical protein FRB96_007345 [Tulasnella sp. 330]